MRFACGDMRDHIVSYQNDHRPSYWRRRALRQQARLRIDFREILRVVRFSTFAATRGQSARSYGRNAEVTAIATNRRNSASDHFRSPKQKLKSLPDIFVLFFKTDIKTICSISSNCYHGRGTESLRPTLSNFRYH